MAKYLSGGFLKLLREMTYPRTMSPTSRTRMVLKKMVNIFFIMVTSEYEKRVSYLYRTATTAYPCSIPCLGEFCRSWSYKTYPLQM